MRLPHRVDFYLHCGAFVFIFWSVLMSKPCIKDWILSKQAKNLGVVYNKPTEQSKKTAAARIKRSIELRFQEEEL
nr:MAG TPA: hypothetical protein [Bacteriophage sp.]